MPHPISTIRRGHVVAMRPSVGGNNLEAVVSFGEHHQELRRLHDLPHRPHIKQAYVQCSERSVDAAERRVVLVAQGLRLGLSRRLIQTGESNRRGSATAAFW